MNQIDRRYKVMHSMKNGVATTMCLAGPAPIAVPA